MYMYKRHINELSSPVLLIISSEIIFIKSDRNGIIFEKMKSDKKIKYKPQENYNPGLKNGRKTSMKSRGNKEGFQNELATGNLLQFGRF